MKQKCPVSHSRDVVLIFPPQWTPMQPYLSIPALTAYLQNHGISVNQCDLNLDFYEKLLSRGQLQPLCCKLEQIFQQLNKKQSLRLEEQRYFYSIYLIRSAFDEVISKIEETKDFFRSEENFFDLSKLSIQKSILNTAINIVNVSCRVELALDELCFPIDVESFEEIAKFISREENNFLLRFFQKQIEDLLTSKKYLLAGISINDSSQLVPALTMTRWIKVHRPEIHITIGGNLLSRCIDGLRNLPDFFRNFADSVVIFEGEKPLLKLIQTIKNGKKLANVPNLIFLDCEKVVQTEMCQPEEINRLPTPDFDGLKLDKYFAPFLILPILSSRGCYWGKCTFCDHSYIYREGFQQRDAEQVANDLRTLNIKYGTRYFSFSDEALSPSASRLISAKIIESKLDVSLLAQVRLETAFSDEICSLMSQAGIKMLFIGLESASLRIQKKIRKGINFDLAPTILKRFYEAGIMVHLFVIFGFPEETVEDSEETIDFILKNKDYVFSVGASTFAIGRHSPISQNPSKYGVTIRSHFSPKPFSYHFNFDYLTGQTEQLVLNLRDRFMQLAIKKLQFGAIWGKLFREQFFLYSLQYKGDDLLKVIKKFHDLEENLCASIDESEVDICNHYPIIRQGVYLNHLNFDILKIQENLKKGINKEVKPENSYLIYDLYRQHSTRVPPEGYAILLLCNGNYTTDEVINVLASLLAMNSEAVKSKVDSFFHEMRTLKILKFLKKPELQ
ncbi:MAG: B12-binding domain-containing radical SAM protein [Candidatus Brocadia sp.]|nr:B12-binding domain-containing radical SAM protein [Candidatus Brocadia sp.]